MAKRVSSGRRIRSRRKYKRSRYARKYSKVSRKGVKRIVNRMIKRNEETKYVSSTVDFNYNQTNVLQTRTIDTIPTIQQGPGAGQRIGNKISIVGARCRVFFDNRWLNTTSNVNWVRVIMYRPRLLVTTAQASADLDFVFTGTPVENIQADPPYHSIEVLADSGVHRLDGNFSGWSWECKYKRGTATYITDAATTPNNRTIKVLVICYNNTANPLSHFHTAYFSYKDA